MDLRIIASLIVVSVIIFITGFSYIITAQAPGKEFVGTLKSCNVYTETDCDTDKKGHTHCSNSYYAMEVFNKNNSTNTCTIQRLTMYSFYGSAQSFCDTRKLGTTRSVYEYWYNAGSCFDDAIRRYMRDIGYSLMFIPICAWIVGLCIVFYEAILEFIRRRDYNIEIFTSKV